MTTLLHPVCSCRYSQQSSRITWLTLDDVGCTTSDVTLGTCSHRGYGAARCDSNEEVALVCHSSAEGEL